MARSILLFVASGFLGNLPLSEAARDLAVSAHFSCALNGDEIKCWGNNNVGQLGIGSTTSIYEPPEESFNLGQDFHPKDIDCGYYHCCAVSTAKTSKCWGGGSHGKLGTGHSGNVGDNANEMGDNIAVIDWGTGFEVESIRCSASHSCAVSSDNTLKCIGQNNNGQLGYGHSNTVGDSADELGDNLPTVDLGTGFDVASIDCGYQYTCAVSTAGKVKCWGYQSVSELGQGHTTLAVGYQPDDMGDNLPFTELGSSFTVSSLSCGSVHCCAFSVDKEIKCWGYGKYGQLGYGSSSSKGQYVSQMGDNLDTVDLGSSFVPVMVSAINSATIAVSANGTVKGWGYSGHGRTGSESTQSIGDAANEMGDNLPRIDLGTGFNATGIAQGFYGQGMCVFDGNQPALTAMKCFGNGQYGMLGYGDSASRGAWEGSMGDNLPFVDVGFTASPTVFPTASPTVFPTALPSIFPTALPTIFPTAMPTVSPTASPTVIQCDALETCDRLDEVEDAVSRLEEAVESLESTLAAMSSLLAVYEADSSHH